MKHTTKFEVIIVGGSYAGLSAAMALGRSLRHVLVIDSGKPCNRQTPHSHNFITQDGKKPSEINDIARNQVTKYTTVQFYDGLATEGKKIENGFEITTKTGEVFTAKKLIFSSGIKDIMPNITGFAECWGISIIHCPYCHGYEYKHKKTGILGNGDYGFEFSKMISNWTKNLTLLTNGKPELLEEQRTKLQEHKIPIIAKEVVHFEHAQGQLKNVVFSDGSKESMEAVYAKVAFIQNSDIPENLGCELNEHGYLQVDMFQKTTASGIFACGDNTTFMRSVANAVAAGTAAGSMCNKELIDEEF